jgi:hypothetical protein
MTFETYHYSIGAHWICAIEYGDMTGLDDAECTALDAFLATLPGPGHWSCAEGQELDIDAVSGMLADCVPADYMMRVES